jgi:hypothetical protein
MQTLYLVGHRSPRHCPDEISLNAMLKSDDSRRYPLPGKIVVDFEHTMTQQITCLISPQNAVYEELIAMWLM